MAVTGSTSAAATLEFDFVALGSGIGGLTAAIAAHDAGLAPVILEKADQIGGVAAYSGGQVWVPGNHVAEREGVPDDWRDGLEYLTWLADGTADRMLLERFSATAHVALRFLEDRAGVRWCSVALHDMYWPDAPGARERGRYVELEPFDGNSLVPEWRSAVRFSPTSWFSNAELYLEMGGHAHRHRWDWERARSREAEDMRFQGSALAGYLVQAVLSRDIPVYTNVEIVEMIFEDGVVKGVAAAIDGQESTVLGRHGTLIAIGGYDWNPDLLRRFDGNTRPPGSRAPRSVTGDHFALVEPLGAQLASVERVPGLGYREPGNAEGPDRWYPFYSGWPHAMSVNRRGERFIDESGGHTRDFGKKMRESEDELSAHMGGDYWAVFDSQYAEKYSVGVHPPGAALPEHFVNAGSLGELAARTGIDSAGLSATVARLNQAAANGHDPDFGRGQNPWSFAQFADPIHRPNPSLGRIDKAPFYAVKLEHVGLGMTRTGLRVDDRARVLGQDGPIPGLYAAGNSMAWMDIGANAHPGTSNARGMTWGYVAAQHAAASHAQRLSAAPRA